MAKDFNSMSKYWADTGIKNSELINRNKVDFEHYAVFVLEKFNTAIFDTHNN